MVGPPALRIDYAFAGLYHGLNTLLLIFPEHGNLPEGTRYLSLAGGRDLSPSQAERSLRVVFAWFIYNTTHGGQGSVANRILKDNYAEFASDVSWLWLFDNLDIDLVAQLLRTNADEKAETKILLDAFVSASDSSVETAQIFDGSHYWESDDKRRSYGALVHKAMTDGFVDFVNEFSKSWTNPEQLLPYESLLDALIYASEFRELRGKAR